MISLIFFQISTKKANELSKVTLGILCNHQFYFQAYKGQLVECQYISTGQPFGPCKSQWYPREHPMFLVKEGNSPVLKRCGFPIVVVRYPYNRKIHPRVKYDNQFATYMLIEEYSGFAPKVCYFSKFYLLPSTSLFQPSPLYLFVSECLSHLIVFSRTI